MVPSPAARRSRPPRVPFGKDSEFEAALLLNLTMGDGTKFPSGGKIGSVRRVVVTLRVTNSPHAEREGYTQIIMNEPTPALPAEAQAVRDLAAASTRLTAEIAKVIV